MLYYTIYYYILYTTFRIQDREVNAKTLITTPPPMDPKEEQLQEIEVLQSIYPDELEQFSESHFAISLPLEVVADRGHRIVLDVRYPELYPETVPQLYVTCESDDINTANGSDDEDDDDAPKLMHLAEQIDFSKEDVAKLSTAVHEEAEANVGIPSVFALAALLKENAEALFQEKLDAAQKKYDDELLAKEREEQKKFHGTKVTKESYAQWRLKFREEIQVEQKDRDRYNNMHKGKLTGREIFEKGLAGNDDDGDDMADLSENVQKVAVN